MTRCVPELLSPAGSLEKLKVAIMYGADAVYLGGEKFGLRSASENFSERELREGLEFAHFHGAKAYVVLNGFLHDHELAELPNFLSFLEEINLDAVIVSDLGVVKTVKKHSSIPIHLSTQASCLNAGAALLWKKVGVERIVLGREVTIHEALSIKQISNLELEMFVHGSLCMAYSGNCVISNYTQGRDSNRGGCAHSCRFEYGLELSQYEKKQATFMSSKDLEGLRVLESFVHTGIECLKIEGRMKSHHYAGTVTKVYREALDFYRDHGHFLSDDLERWEEELRKVSHRDYFTGSLEMPADTNSIFVKREATEGNYRVGAVILEAIPGKYLLAEVRSSFSPGDELELVPFKGGVQSFRLKQLTNIENRPLKKTNPGSLVKIPYRKGAERLNLLRVRDSGS